MSDSDSSLYPQFPVLLIDDETSFLRSMSLTLERNDITHIHTCSEPRAVPELMKKLNAGLVLLDLTMPGLSGRDLLSWFQEEYPDVCVIIISGLNQVEAAVDCVKQGAFDYFVKTTEQSQIIEGIKRAIRTQELSIENQILRRQMLTTELQKPELFDAIITSASSMWSVFKYLESIARTNQPILICGESGVGKELFANVAHSLSLRKGELVTVNVAGLDDDIFADTLFGHSRGAFTGADKERPGLVEKAAGGTLFLDEIGDLSLASQVKLLRLLQEGEYYPLGSDKPKRIQARVIVATHQDLALRQDEGSFRKDLFFRLKTHQVKIPPLRERLSDLPILIDHFVKLACDELDKSYPRIPKSLPILLSSYSFPGNTRELKALVYDAVSRSHSETLDTSSFTHLLDKENINLAHGESVTFQPGTPIPTLTQMAEQLVTEAMSRAQGNQSLAARMLGVSQPALSKRLKNMKR